MHEEPPGAARGHQPGGAQHREVLPRRWVAERTFARISKHRRTVRDYERLPASHEAMIVWAMIALMARRLTQPADLSSILAERLTGALLAAYFLRRGAEPDRIDAPDSLSAGQLELGAGQRAADLGQG